MKSRPSCWLQRSAARSRCDWVSRYAVLVTSTEHEILALAQVYRDRADAENTFDELKNPRGWGSFTTQDLARCRIMARMVAVVDNW